MNTWMVQADLPSKKRHTSRRILLSGVTFLVLAAVAFTLLSPIPVSLVIRAAFHKKIAVAPEHYDEMKSHVDVLKNLCYPSDYSDNVADIYIPKDTAGPFPVVLWIHGGAFVGGSKDDVEIYATSLASEGIAVVCMNYRRAPKAKYPVPVIQTQDAYLWMMDISDKYSFDLNRFVLAGDSAGAHIAAQFAAIQSNAAYADEMDFEQIVPLHTLKAVLLFCGPFDVSKLDKSRNSTMNFLIGRAAWAYFGTKDWAGQFSYQATISHHITEFFPPAFITDGNQLSFEEHGRALADVLKNSNVSVETYFISMDTEIAGHEYQFIMNTPAGIESFHQVVRFLKKHTG